VSFTETDRFAAARTVADAVLYEGYVLYPYRASSRKNQVRWQFGVLVPPAFAEVDSSERSSARTECLVEAGSAPVLAVRIRCLQVQHRSVEASSGSSGDEDLDGDGFVPVATLEAGGQVHVEWDEAIDRTVDLSPLSLPLLGEGHEEAFAFEGGTDVEPILVDGAVAGRIVRRRRPVDGLVRVRAASADGGGSLVKVVVTVENSTSWTGTSRRRDDVIGSSLVAVHTMLAVDDGAFVSMLDPPPAARDAVAACHSDGTFPVLIGGNGVVLSSPIILYDQPEVAPESPGDLYDATEIDEILALRVLTLTEDEKSEARGTDPRAAAIIDRCDDMPPEMWERLHGAVRTLHPAGADGAPAFADGGPPAFADGGVPVFGEDGVPVFAGEGVPVISDEGAPWWDPGVDASVDPWSDSVMVDGVEVAKGTAVRLCPSHRADAQDLFIAGLTATVAGVFKDVDGSEHVAVTVDDDPATGELAWQGRYLFFHPDEVEPLAGRQETR
jgi:hypothetical protein